LQRKKPSFKSSLFSLQAIKSQQDAANYVLTGRPVDLLKRLRVHPGEFFKKVYKISDAANQIFHGTVDAGGKASKGVTPDDLIYFLCEDNMQKQVYNFAQALPEVKREHFLNLWKTKQASRGRGGADIVVIKGPNIPEVHSGMPPSPPFNFDNILQTTRTFDVFGNRMTATISLLKNPNGVVCYFDADDKEHWYDVNCDEKTIKAISNPVGLSGKDKEDYDALVTTLKQMESDTATINPANRQRQSGAAIRSSNRQHALIEKFLHRQTINADDTITYEPIILHREGLHFTQDEIEYIDTHHDFNRLLNALLNCIRLYDAGNDAEGHKVWRAVVGHTEREVMWLLQAESFTPAIG
jgi:hypothetical protein